MKLAIKSMLVAVATIGMVVSSTGAASATSRHKAPTIVDTAISVNQQSGEFSTLIAALKCTGLVSVLDARGPKFTVFAPTDAAFAKAGVNKDTVCSAFSRKQLSNILLYHVNIGQKDAATVLSRQKLLMANVQFARISGATIDGQNIVTTDIRTGNGIIHIIDGVMLP